MDIAHWAASHRRSILFLVSMLALAGILSSFNLPVSLFPHTDFPRVVVSIETGDRPADQMVIAVTRKVEQAVRSVPGVVNMRSTTSRGSAELSINFNWGMDMVSAMLQVESAVNEILPSLPPGTSFRVKRMDPTKFPVVSYSLVSDKVSLVKLRDLAEFQLVPIFSSIKGVSKVDVTGGARAEYRVEIDPAKLQAYNIGFNDVAKALSASNVLQAVGRMEDHYKLYLLLSDTRLRSLGSLKDTVIRSGTSGLVRLNDIASIYPATVPQWIRVTADGHDAVLVDIYQQPGSNTVQIAHDVKQTLLKHHNIIPPKVKISNWYDQSQLITESASSVRDAIIIGIVLAALVLFVFLRSLKITIIAILIVPAVLATTILLLKVLNMSFNIMTLGGMAAAVGLIVDDAIVMIEHIIRRLREKSNNVALTIRHAAIEFTYPLMGSSFATIIIFAPLTFLSGVTGAFFKALSLTMASSLFISFLISLLAVPLIAEHLLHAGDAEKEDVGPIFKVVLRGYQRLMTRILISPWLLLLGIVPLVFAGYMAYKQVGSDFMPHMDEGGFILDYETPAGTSLAETDRLLKQIAAIIRANPAVQTYSRRTGTQLGGGLTEANSGDFFVRLKPLPRKPIDEVMNDIRQQIDKNVPGIDTEMALLMEDLIGDLTSVPQPIEVKLFGDSKKALYDSASRVAAKLGSIKGVVDVRDGIVRVGDAINVVVDRDKAALEGVDPEWVTQQLKVWYQGEVTTKIQQNLKMVGVRIWIPRSSRNLTSSLDKAVFRAPDGHLVSLKRIAHFVVDSGQAQITRENLKSMVSVTGRIAGRDLGSTIKDVTKVLDAKGTLDKGVYYELGGLYKQQQIAFKGMIAVFLAAFALVFFLLLFLYEEFAAAIAIMVSPVLAMSAVFIGLWVTGISLNITAMMGMTMILGIVTEVSIFYFSEYHQLVKKGEDKNKALILAGTNRLRPIVMTTLAAILALLPLAMALGQGSAMQQPLAIAIISGLLVQTFLVTLVMPVIYKALAGKGFKNN
jgi:CzcA family heavy metal efflux pump